jgi:hypothetical protein
LPIIDTAMTASSYIDLHRRFVPYDNATVGERDDHNFRLAWQYGSNSWEEVLTNRCTVIIAEGGTGKTEELPRRSLDPAHMNL